MLLLFKLRQVMALLFTLAFIGGLILLNVIAASGKQDAFAILSRQLQAVSDMTIIPLTLYEQGLSLLSRGGISPGMEDGMFTILGWSALITLGGTLIGLIPGLIMVGLCSWRCARSCKRQLTFALKNPLHVLNVCHFLRLLALYGLLAAAGIPLPWAVNLACVSWLVLTVSLIFIWSFRQCMPY
ncbi:MAG: hypothetical protein IAA31_07605 [Candidatus Anaerobiospirillum merdipullorum]|uniref:Uncharacterized protein n=1 Tax=Candidatus Anaerobiospirillum merdipullorum TaxID=2838450 RepID=A0A9E2KQS1_9GAMM|nr:hypothetical protein [Candidatus Anaerobiospirillum merdipullorum]